LPAVRPNVSPGCIRALNNDVIDLYSRTPVGTKVAILQARVI
jgi:lipoprotein-anchoring transpeptidase ErfK/SrfK